jgi:hypothetical protein
MGVILMGIAAAIVIAIGASFVLDAKQETAWQVYSTQSTRVGEPGDNLVGPAWSGEPGGSATQAEGEETPG